MRLPVLLVTLLAAPAHAGQAFSDDQEILNTRMFHWRRGVATGLAARCDVVIFKEGVARYREPGRAFAPHEIVTVFINNRDYKSAAGLRHVRSLFGARENGVVVIIAGADWTWPRQRDFRKGGMKRKQVQEMQALVNESHLRHVWVENLDLRFSPKVSALPLGVSTLEMNRDVNPHNLELWTQATLGYYLPHANTDANRPMLASYSGRARPGLQWLERTRVAGLADAAWAPCMGATNIGNLSHGEFLDQLARYPFAVAVHGGGNDPNPRIWETLLVGSIPITRRLLSVEIYEELDLPVVVVEGDWSDATLSAANLREWHAKWQGHLVGEKRKQVLEKLTMDFWWKRITTS